MNTPAFICDIFSKLINKDLVMQRHAKINNKNRRFVSSKLGGEFLTFSQIYYV